MPADDPLPATTPLLPPAARVSLIEIFLVYARIGLFSFGGGLTGWMYREAVLERRWMAEDEFLSGLALCQILPGANVTNLAVYIGQRLRGLAGACAGLGGLLVGPFFACIGFYLVYDRIASYAAVQPALEGVAAAAIGLLLLVGLKGGQRAAANPAMLLVIAVLVVTVGLLQWPLAPVVLCIAPVSVALGWAGLRRHA